MRHHTTLGAVLALLLLALSCVSAPCQLRCELSTSACHALTPTHPACTGMHGDPVHRSSNVLVGHRCQQSCAASAILFSSDSRKHLPLFSPALLPASPLATLPEPLPLLQHPHLPPDPEPPPPLHPVLRI